jgi:hypothetical protein
LGLRLAGRRRRCGANAAVLIFVFLSHRCSPPFKIRLMNPLLRLTKSINLCGQDSYQLSTIFPTRGFNHYVTLNHRNLDEGGG